MRCCTVPCRRPSAAGRTAYQTEQLILQSSRPGRLCTYVVCPGLLYGSGEASHTFFAWAKTAWEMQPGRWPRTAGPGANILPTTHVRDLAAYVASLATFQPIKDTSLSSTLTRTTGVLSTMGRTAGRPATAAAANPNASLAGRGPEHRYFLVADAGRSTQVQLAEAFSKALGSGEVT